MHSTVHVVLKRDQAKRAKAAAPKIVKRETAIEVAPESSVTWALSALTTAADSEADDIDIAAEEEDELLEEEDMAEEELEAVPAAGISAAEEGCSISALWLSSAWSLSAATEEDEEEAPGWSC